MRKYRSTITLALAAGIASVLLYFMKGVDGFPQQIMLIFWPAQYVLDLLLLEVGKGTAGVIVGNVAVFAILAAIEGALVGFILDSFAAYRVAALTRRVKVMSYSKSPVDIAFRRRVLEVLAEYDPAGLLTITTDKQAYEPAVKMILGNRKRFHSAGGLKRFCRRTFRKLFGRHAVKGFDRYDDLAADIWTGYKQSRSAPRQAPPTSPGA